MRKAQMQTFEDLIGGPKPKPGLRSQAKRILDRFGGPRRLAEILETIGYSRNPATIYKWQYPRAQSGHGGTGGRIPTDMWAAIIKAAHYDGIMLTSEDFDPRELP